MLLLACLTEEEKKAKLVRNLRKFGYKGASRARFAVWRRVDLSIREERWRLEKELEEGTGDTASILKALEIRKRQIEFHRMEARYGVTKPMWVTKQGRVDPVLRRLDRKVDGKFVCEDDFNKNS